MIREPVPKAPSPLPFSNTLRIIFIPLRRDKAFYNAPDYFRKPTFSHNPERKNIMMWKNVPGLCLKIPTVTGNTTEKCLMYHCITPKDIITGIIIETDRYICYILHEILLDMEEKMLLYFFNQKDLLINLSINV